MPELFVIYADFEVITEKIQTCIKKSKSYTEAYQKHTDYGYGYKVFCYDDKYSKPVQIYRGENAVYKFMEKMFQEVKNCKNTAKNISEKNSKLLKKMRKTSNKQKNATFVAKHTQRKTKYSEITVISQENTEDLHIQIVTSIISD